MKQFKHWKSILLAALLPLLVALQPAITYACSAGVGGHCGG